jgi:hypothetical protein
LALFATSAFAQTDIYFPFKVYETDGIARENVPIRFGGAFEDSTVNAIEDVRICGTEFNGLVRPGFLKAKATYPRSDAVRWGQFATAISVGANDSMTLVISDADSTRGGAMTITTTADKYVVRDKSDSLVFQRNSVKIKTSPNVWTDLDGDGVCETKILVGDNANIGLGHPDFPFGDQPQTFTDTWASSTLDIVDSSDHFVSFKRTGPLFNTSGAAAVITGANAAGVFPWGTQANAWGGGLPGQLYCTGDTMRFEQRIYYFTNTRAIKTQFTLHNPSCSDYRDVQDDYSTVDVYDVSLDVDPDLVGTEANFGTGARWPLEWNDVWDNTVFVLEQASSGLSTWDDMSGYLGGKFQHPYRGYRILSGNITDPKTEWQIMNAEGTSNNPIGTALKASDPADWPYVSTRSGDHAAGYAQLHGRPATGADSVDVYVGVGMEYFWQNYPTALWATAGQLNLKALTRITDGMLPWIRGGQAKNWDYWIAWGKEEHEPNTAPDRLAQLIAPLHVMPDPVMTAYARPNGRFSTEAFVADSTDWQGPRLHLRGWYVDRDSFGAADHAKTFEEDLEVGSVYGWFRFGNVHGEGAAGARSLNNWENDALRGVLMQGYRTSAPIWWKYLRPGVQNSAFSVLSWEDMMYTNWGDVVEPKLDGLFAEHDRGNASFEGRGNEWGRHHDYALGAMQSSVVLWDDYALDRFLWKCEQTLACLQAGDCGNLCWCKDACRHTAWVTGYMTEYMTLISDSTDVMSTVMSELIEPWLPANKCWLDNADGWGRPCDNYLGTSGCDSDCNGQCCVYPTHHMGTFLDAMERLQLEWIKWNNNDAGHAQLDSVIYGHANWISKYAVDTALGLTDGMGYPHKMYVNSEHGFAGWGGTIDRYKMINGMLAAYDYGGVAEWDDQCLEAMRAVSTCPFTPGSIPGTCSNARYSKFKDMSDVLRSVGWYSWWLTSGKNPAKPAEPTDWDPDGLAGSTTQFTIPALMWKD